MRLAVFPDERSVVLRRTSIQNPETVHDATNAAAVRYSIPDDDGIRSLGISFSDTSRSPASGPVNDVVGLFGVSDLVTTAIQRAGGAYEVVARRRAAYLLDIDDYWAVNRAYHLAYWNRGTQFCGICGSAMEQSTTETAKRCSACGRTVYPRISPAVIVAVVRDGRLLMANSRRHPGGMFSVLAGFVEPGETLEDTVTREMYEESGVSVRNVQYFSSQPWPFPDALMIAFTAEYASGELVAQDDEISELRWVAPDQIPLVIPGTYSVARRLIEWFVSEHGSDDDLLRLVNREQS